MKKFISFIICVTVSFISSAQISKQSNYSLEISSGIPALTALFISHHNSHPDVYDYESNGICYRDNHAQQLNIAFKWVENDRWDFIAMLGVATNTTKQYQYRTFVQKTGDDIPEDVKFGYWEGGPDFVKRKFGMGNLYFSGFSRIKYAHTKHMHLYTAFGLGIDLATATTGYPLMPYLSPIGISIGENRRIYGFTELTLGTGGTLILGGIGIRIFE